MIRINNPADSVIGQFFIGLELLSLQYHAGKPWYWVPVIIP
jgi:hypothetical protein